MRTLGLVRDVLALVTVFGLTGFLAGVALFPGRLQPARRLYLSLALSSPTTVAIAIPFVATGHLSIFTTLAGLSALFGLAALRYWRRPGARRAPSRELQKWRGGLRVRRLATFAVAAGAVCSLVFVGPQVESRRTDGLPLQSTTWWYWWLAEEIAEAGGIPSESGEWGGVHSFQQAYIGSTIHTAAAMQLAGGTDLLFEERYRLALVAFALVAFFALWRRWLPAWWALIAALLSLTTTKAFSKFLAYRPETFGLVLVAWSGWLLAEALERRSPRWGALAGLVAGVAYVSHAEMWILTGPLWAGIVCAHFLVGNRRHAPGRPRVQRWRTHLRGWLPAFLVALPTCLLTIVAIQVATAGREHAVSVPGLASDWQPRRPDGTDLTWQLYAAIWNPAAVEAPPRLPCANPFLSRSARFPWSGLDLKHPAPSYLALFGTLLAFAALPYGLALARGSRRIRAPGIRPCQALIVGLALTLGTLLVVAAFCALYDTYVPQRTGKVRIEPYHALGLAGVLALLGYASARGAFALLRRSPLIRPSRVRVRVAGGVAIALASLALAPLMTTEVGEEKAHAISPPAYQAYRWLDVHAPADAVVLANAFTDGQIAAIAHRTGWLDGRLPFLEATPWLQDSVTMLLTARRYFERPGTSADIDLGTVDYVVVAKPRVYLGGPYIRGRNPFRANLDLLDEQAALTRVAVFGKDAVRIYAVTRADEVAARSAPPPASLYSRDLPARAACSPL